MNIATTPASPLRVLPWAEDICISQSGPGQTVLGLVESEVHLPEELVYCIGGHGHGGVILFQLLAIGLTVNGSAGRNKDDLLDASFPGGLQNVQEPKAVHLRVEQRIAGRHDDAHLGSVMIDDIGFFDLEDLLQLRGADIHDVSSTAPLGTFSLAPVLRSSTTTTWWPAARYAATTWEPMKPAPPVTRIFMREL